MPLRNVQFENLHISEALYLHTSRVHSYEQPTGSLVLVTKTSNTHVKMSTS